LENLYKDFNISHYEIIIEGLKEGVWFVIENGDFFNISSNIFYIVFYSKSKKSPYEIIQTKRENDYIDDMKNGKEI